MDRPCKRLYSMGGPVATRPFCAQTYVQLAQMPVNGSKRLDRWHNPEEQSESAKHGLRLGHLAARPRKATHSPPQSTPRSVPYVNSPSRHVLSSQSGQFWQSVPPLQVDGAAQPVRSLTLVVSDVQPSCGGHVSALVPALGKVVRLGEQELPVHSDVISPLMQKPVAQSSWPWQLHAPEVAGRKGR